MKEIVVRGIFLILGFLLILLTSCENDLGSESFVNLDDEYELFVTQELSPNGGLASLEIRTSHELACSNYSIPYELILNPQDILLIIDNLTIEGSCIAQPTIISEVVDFDLDNSEKNISISLQDVVSNSGKISSTEEEISLELQSNDGLKISKARINRIPKYMMWGDIEKGEASSISEINTYIESIRLSTDVKKGDYGYFYINNSNNLQFYDSANNSNNTFAFFSETSLMKIEEKISEIKENDPTLVFQMTIYDGQTINVL